MLAGPKVGDDLARDFDYGADAGVRAEPRAAVLDEEGAPKPRISIRSLRASAVPSFLKTASITRSTSLCCKCGLSSAILRISSDFVMAVSLAAAHP
jgi:hypothetical protein